MRLLEFERHLKKYGCLIIREGGNHTIFQNLKNCKISPVPRHREIKNLLVIKICKQLEIPSPFN